MSVDDVINGHEWASDLDHADPAYNANAPEIWAHLRESGCPVAHTERYGGMWAPLTHELVKEVAYDTEHFSSQGVIVSNARPIIEAPVGPAPPITSDPPFHQVARRLLLPPFAPKQIDPWEKEIRVLCRDLLDAMGPIEAGTSVIDAAVQYAQHIPVNVIARMIGLPTTDDDLFRGFVHAVLEAVDLTAEERIAAIEPLAQYLDAKIAEHVENPRDDLITYLLNVEIGGNKLNPEHVRGSIVLLLVAGIDTTWSAIGSSLRHLASHPDDLARLVAEPELMPFAIEELLRAYAPVTMARLVKDDHDFHGCPMKANEWVLLPFPAANRDPQEFADADQVIIDRQENRHSAFGLGIHRCLGSNLARLELRVAVEEFIARFPAFELAGDVRWSVGQVRGPRVMPVRIVETASGGRSS
jgi:cytochrome P450